MRLTGEGVAAIKAAAAAAFGETAVARLFGSRVRDDLRGGDIDLHFEVDEGDQDYRKAAAFRWRLFDQIEEQKVDLVFRVRGRATRPIDEIAYDEGLVL